MTFNLFDTFSKYFIKKWFQLFVLSTLSLYLLVAIGDLVNNIFRNKYTLELILHNHYLNSSMIFANVLPISILLASILLLNQLKIHSELIAALSLGYSLFRLGFLAFFCSLFVCVIHFWNVGYFSPHLLHLRSAFKSSIEGNSSTVTDSKIWIKNKFYMANYDFYEKLNRKMINPSFYFNDKNFMGTKLIKGATAIYQDNGNWLVTNALVIEHLYPDDFSKISNHLTYLLKLNESPDTLQDFQGDLFSLNFHSLYKFLIKLKDSGLYLREYYLSIYERIASVFICFSLSLIPFAFPMGISSRNSSPGKSLLLGILMAVSLLAISKGISTLLNWNVIPPFITAMLFPCGFFFYQAYRLWPKIKL